MAIEVFNRFEHKYLLDKNTFEKIISVIDKHMEPDRYNINHRMYTISNIYFDTKDDYLIRQSLQKPVYKEKLRLRAYSTVDLQSEVFLEIKKKYNGIVNKRRTALKLFEAYDFIKTGNLYEIKEYMNSQVVEEIAYFLKCYKVIPKVYLAYDRLAYFERGNPDLRISFDHNIRSRRYNLALEEGDYGKALIDSNTYLMEIKTAAAKPLWLCDILTNFKIRRKNFSKYGTEFRRFMEENKKLAI